MGKIRRKISSNRINVSIAIEPSYPDRCCLHTFAHIREKGKKQNEKSPFAFYPINKLKLKSLQTICMQPMRKKFRNTGWIGFAHKVCVTFDFINSKIYNKKNDLGDTWD